MHTKSDFPKLKNKAVLSPMAGVTDVAFRALSKKYGAALTYTEFINSTGLVRGNGNTSKMLQTDPIEKPVAVQLFGNNVDDVVEAARQMEDRFDIIDVNCGCPAWKVIQTGAGSAMLNDPDKISTFINRLASAVSKPVTIKIRSGIDHKTINAVEVAKVAEDAGAAALAIHGRTQKQAYQGQADWDIIKQVKEAINIPVIGNGDVFTPETFKQRLEESGVDFIMIARGAIGNPYVFTQINDFVETGSYQQPEKFKLFFEYLELAKNYNIDFTVIKTHALYFTKGLEGGSVLRRKISECKTIPELEDVLSSLVKIH